MEVILTIIILLLILCPDFVWDLIKKLFGVSDDNNTPSSTQNTLLSNTPIIPSSSINDNNTTISTSSNCTHIIGVMFKGQEFGCYYYIGNNFKYKIGDIVIVPTNKGQEEAVVVFKKIYGENETLPYEKAKLKIVIKKK